MSVCVGIPFFDRIAVFLFVSVYLMEHANCFSVYRWLQRNAEFMFSEVVSVLRVLWSWVALSLFNVYTVNAGLVMEKHLVVSILNKTP